MGDVGTGGGEVAAVLGEDPLVIVNVEQRKLLASLAGLEVGVLQDDDESLLFFLGSFSNHVILRTFLFTIVKVLSLGFTHSITSAL